jgi:phosphoglycolate phosphatase
MWHGVIFDFDMTLADTSKGVKECINFALEKLGFPTVSLEHARKTIGLTLPETFMSLTGIVDTSVASSFARYFVQKADEVMESLTTLYAPVPMTVKLLSERGFILAIISTKFRYRIENILDQHGLRQYFDLIVGGEDVTEHKPDPSGILLALTRLCLQPGEVVYVGDHVIDAETAKRANLPFIGVLQGNCQKDDFARYQVVALIDDISALPSFL